MTDKKRFEKIEHFVDLIDFIPRDDRGMGEMDVNNVKNDMEWLIGRVKELEKKLSINTNNMKQLQKQNQYYKQALEEIRGLYPLRNVGYQVSEIRKIVIKALEGKK